VQSRERYLVFYIAQRELGIREKEKEKIVIHRYLSEGPKEPKKSKR
jgi:hypothetical protein